MFGIDWMVCMVLNRGYITILSLNCYSKVICDALLFNHQTPFWLSENHFSVSLLETLVGGLKIKGHNYLILVRIVRSSNSVSHLVHCMIYDM